MKVQYRRCVEDEDFIDQERDWSEYFRIIFPKVSLGDIKKFEEKYKGSEEEREDLKEIYISSKGDMDIILDSIMCSTIDDEPRYREILLDMIKKNEVEDFKSFSRENKKKKESRRKRVSNFLACYVHNNNDNDIHSKVLT
ncbi:hypothetical protein QYM36_016729 [Artemia franciscana]|uniref:DNAJC9 HTH domain-containing protein n=1 Tax=Artemia franciscana TaxID=6661 RepID=A0AA88L1Q2_ARTSF|nr:hypothetical protein QYM36_016729 [Artemia franciscana]